MNLPLLLGSLYGFIGVALGAFGAHSMRGVYAIRAMEIFETGVKYQMYHAAVLVALGALAVKGQDFRGPTLCFAIGTFIFSASLYALVFTNWRWFGAITPIGGLTLLVGWGWLIWRAAGVRHS